MLDESFGQNLGYANEARPSTVPNYGKVSKCERSGKSGGEYPTSFNADSMVISLSDTSSERILPVSITRGTTLAAMRIAMNNEAIGSNPVHP